MMTFLLMVVSAFAMDPSCSAPTWVGAHGIDSGQYKGTLSTTCRVQLALGAQGGGCDSMDLFLRDSTATSGILHSGPTAETYAALPSFFYDVTTTTLGSDSIRIDADFHIATDHMSKLAYAMISRDVHGSGNSELVRKIDFAFDVSGPAADGSFTAVIRQTLNLAKPWYAPGGIFTSEAEKQFQQSFGPQVDSTLRDLREHL